MSNFALTSLALSSVCPTNKVIVDDKGDPSVMVERPAQMLNALLTNGDSTVHPAFLVNGVQRKKLAFGKFQSIVHNSRAIRCPTRTRWQALPWTRSSSTARTRATASTASPIWSGRSWRFWRRRTAQCRRGTTTTARILPKLPSLQFRRILTAATAALAALPPAPAL